MYLIDINLPMETRSFHRYKIQEYRILHADRNPLFQDHTTKPRRYVDSKNKITIMMIKPTVITNNQRNYC